LLYEVLLFVVWTIFGTNNTNNNTSYNNFTHPTGGKHAECDHAKKKAVNQKSIEAESLDI
jgi:hypothetical protein